MFLSPAGPDTSDRMPSVICARPVRRVVVVDNLGQGIAPRLPPDVPFFQVDLRQTDLFARDSCIAATSIV